MGVINADSCVDKRVGSWWLYKVLVLRSETGSIPHAVHAFGKPQATDQRSCRHGRVADYL